MRNQVQDEPEAGPSTAPSAVTTSNRRGRSTRVSDSAQICINDPHHSQQASGYASDDLDEPEGQAEDMMDVDGKEKANSSKSRNLSKAAEAKLKAKEKKKRKKKDSEEEEEEDAYTALSKSLWQNITSRPPIGSFENCSTCSKQFTVVK